MRPAHFLYIGLAAGSPILLREHERSAGPPKQCTLKTSATHVLDNSFHGNTPHSFLQTTTAQPLCKDIDSLFNSYDTEFASLFASDATLDLFFSDPDGHPIADEMGIWVWDHNQVWTASTTVSNTFHVSILDLTNKTVKRLVSSNGVEVLNPNGGAYLDGKVYIASDGNDTVPPFIYAVDPATMEVQVVVNSHFGLHLNGSDDLIWLTRGDKSWLFFADDPLSFLYNGGTTPQLPDATWRLDLTENILLQVIDKIDLSFPNGIRVNKNGTKLYVTDTPSSP